MKKPGRIQNSKFKISPLRKSERTNNLYSSDLEGKCENDCDRGETTCPRL